MANNGFLTAVETILKHEGGFVNNPADRGGATNWGITQKTYEKYKGRPVTLAEIKNMPRSEAIAIYKKNYWDTVGGDNIKFYSTALTMFDQAVNRGPATVIKQAQKIIGHPQTGVPTAQTISAINAMPDNSFVSQLIKLSQESYNKIVANDPSQSVFIKGWTNRLSKLQSEASKFYGQVNVKAVGIGLVTILVAGVSGYFFYQFLKRRKST